MELEMGERASAMHAAAHLSASDQPGPLSALQATKALSSQQVHHGKAPLECAWRDSWWHNPAVRSRSLDSQIA